MYGQHKKFRYLKPWSWNIRRRKNSQILKFTLIPLIKLHVFMSGCTSPFWALLCYYTEKGQLWNYFFICHCFLSVHSTLVQLVAKNYMVKKGKILTMHWQRSLTDRQTQAYGTKVAGGKFFLFIVIFFLKVTASYGPNLALI